MQPKHYLNYTKIFEQKFANTLILHEKLKHYFPKRYFSSKETNHLN